MQRQVSKSEFKTRALELLRDVENTGESLIVTDRGKPTIEVRACIQVKSSPLARLRGTVRRYENPTAPVGVNEWETLR